MSHTMAWQEFLNAARADGSLIERLIRDFYTNELLSPTDNVIDGGAHTGLHTMPLAALLVQGRVVGVDANATLVERLREKVGPMADRVRVEFAALQSDPDAASIQFNISTSHIGRSGVSRLWDRIAPGTVTYEPPITVPATTLDKLATKHGLSSLAFVKLDLEGGEFGALRGARGIMRSARPVFVTEHSSQSPEVNGFTVKEYFDYLASFDYVVLSPDGEPASVRAPFPCWYVFLVPRERADWASAALARCAGRAAAPQAQLRP